jgi:hypothetical protein
MHGFFLPSLATFRGCRPVMRPFEFAWSPPCATTATLSFTITHVEGCTHFVTYTLQNSNLHLLRLFFFFFAIYLYNLFLYLFLSTKLYSSWSQRIDRYHQSILGQNHRLIWTMLTIWIIIHQFGHSVYFIACEPFQCDSAHCCIWSVSLIEFKVVHCAVCWWHIGICEVAT